MKNLLFIFTLSTILFSCKTKETEVIYTVSLFDKYLDNKPVINDLKVYFNNIQVQQKHYGFSNNKICDYYDFEFTTNKIDTIKIKIEFIHTGGILYNIDLFRLNLDKQKHVIKNLDYQDTIINVNTYNHFENEKLNHQTIDGICKVSYTILVCGTSSEILKLDQTIEKI